MTEAEWLNGHVLSELLKEARPRFNERKLRLFACAAGRRLWHLLYDPRSQQAIEVSERYADGAANWLELMYAAREAGEAAKHAVTINRWWNAAETAAAIAGTAWEGAERAAIRAADMTLFREIFGNPFRPVDLPVLDSETLAMARSFYDEQSMSGLPILADALEERGCTDQPLLRHLRNNGLHYRGCWALDAILGLETQNTDR
jgi:hypothetical protein